MEKFDIISELKRLLINDEVISIIGFEIHTGRGEQ